MFKDYKVNSFVDIAAKFGDKSTPYKTSSSSLPYPIFHLPICVLQTTKLFTNIYETMYLNLRFRLPESTKLFTFHFVTT